MKTSIATYCRVLRHAMSPAAAVAIARMYQATDVRDALPLIQAPTLVTYLTDDKIGDPKEDRYIAAYIPGATSHEVPGDDHMWRLGTSETGAAVEVPFSQAYGTCTGWWGGEAASFSSAEVRRPFSQQPLHKAPWRRI